MSDPSGTIDRLYASLDSRLRAEDVAALILASGQEFTPAEASALRQAARRGNPSAADTPPAPEPLAALRRRDPYELSAAITDPDAVRLIGYGVGEPIFWTATEQADGRLGRLDREVRGIKLSRRQYNRGWRVLTKVDARIGKLEVALRSRGLPLAGRAGLAADITADRFRRDPAAGALAAYLAARRRRRFGGDSPMDQIARLLLGRLHDGSDWWLVARVHCSTQVAGRLSPAERAALLSRWSELTVAMAGALRHAWDPAVDRATMLAAPGAASSTWNIIAQAYNAARSGWLGVVSTLDAPAPDRDPGKAALMTVEESPTTNLAAWTALPPPWEVLTPTS